MAAGFALPGFLERWRTDWIDPALDYIEGQKPKSDSHLNDVSIEYPEEDVKVATQNFDPSCMLGSGTFGSVYRGIMGDGTEVAVKVLQVPEEAGFEDEVKVLSRFRHPNLVILMGFARHADSGGRSLIYEYLSGGDVSKRLQRSRQHSEPFEWKPRVSAAVDAACGLSHLHNMQPRAFHRDIKGPNILLDRNGTAKMADFGLSCVASGSEHKVRQASGTVGYACPEYIRTGIITEGSEVHSFGMVLLEILTGAPPAVQRPDKPNEYCYLVDHLQGSTAKVIQMLDPSGHFPTQISQALTELAFRCIHHVPNERPLFKQLVEELRYLYQHADDRQGDAQKSSDAADQSRHRPEQHQGQQPQQPQQQSAPGVRRVVLAVGTAVEVKMARRSGWFCGRIARVNPNGTFAIRFHDGDVEDNVPVDRIRPLEAPPQASQQPAAAPQQHQQHMAVAAAGGDPLAVTAHAGGQAHRPFAFNPNPPAPPPPPPAAAAAGVAAALRQQGHAAGHGQALPPPPPPVAVGERGQREDAVQVAMPSCRLWCVYAEGVELSKLEDHQRAIPLPTSGQELVVGRTAQPAILWDTLVPDRRLHSTVSRGHFKVVTRRAQAAPPGAQEQVSFFLACMSQNGVLLNSKYVGPGEEGRPLQHGDVIAFTASSEVNGQGGSMRKPFIVFSFEVARPEAPVADASAGLAHQAPPQQPPPPQAEEERQQPMPLQPQSQPQQQQQQHQLPQQPPMQPMRPPDHSVVGRWRSAEAGPAVLEDAIFCLEVHGEHCCMDLPSEARQIFFCCDHCAATLPTLRIGQSYQLNFWQRVLRPGLLSSRAWPAILAVDHFEICSVRRTNPMSSEPPDWRFRLHILDSAGMTVNYSVVCNSGDERELHPSDTLTVGAAASASSSATAGSAAPAQRSSSDAAGLGLPRGLHFTFIPLVGSLTGPGAEPLLSERPRQLPDVEALWGDDGDAGGLGEPGGLAFGTSSASRQPASSSQWSQASSAAAPFAASGKGAGILKPPTALTLFDQAEGSEGAAAEESSLATPLRDDSTLAAAATALNQQPAAALGTYVLGPGPLLQEDSPHDPDDLFSRTGFHLSGIPEEAGGAGGQQERHMSAAPLR